jgi:hypothetical protein
MLNTINQSIAHCQVQDMLYYAVDDAPRGHEGHLISGHYAGTTFGSGLSMTGYSNAEGGEGG